MRAPLASMEMLLGIQAIAETGDRRKAAKLLSITLSGLDKRLTALSRILGDDVILHIGKEIELTKTAKLYLRDANRAIEFALLAEQRTKAHLLLERNKLVVGHSTYLAARLLKLIHSIEFDAGEHITIEHRTGFTSTIAARVAAATLHAGFGFLPLEHGELSVRALFEEPIVVCLPASHRLVSVSAVQPIGLMNEPVIAVGRESHPALDEEIEEYFAQFGIELKIAQDAFSPHEALTLVEQEKGICLLAASSVTERRSVVTKPLATKGLVRKSGVFVRSDHDHPLIAKFVQRVVQLFDGAKPGKGKS